MAIDADTGLITWTPATGQDSLTPVTVQATDAAGNTGQQEYSINVLATNAVPVLTAANPSMGSTNEDTAATIALAAFINTTDGTTITDSDNGAVIGGIAPVGTSGLGTWQYSLDGGTTFVAVGTVSDNSAPLLPADAVLSYTPDVQSGETATITYRAWDTTGGASGIRVDLSQDGAVGGLTAYSTGTDTASLTVNYVNNAPVLTAASPLLGTVTSNSPMTTALATFINNGPGTTTITDVDPGAVVGESP